MPGENYTYTGGDYGAPMDESDPAVLYAPIRSRFMTPPFLPGQPIAGGQFPPSVYAPGMAGGGNSAAQDAAVDQYWRGGNAPQPGLQPPSDADYMSSVDAYQKLAAAGPATVKPTFRQRLAAALVAGGSSIMGHPEVGIRSGMDIMQRPQNEAIANYQRQLAQAQAAMKAQESMYGIKAREYELGEGQQERQREFQEREEDRKSDRDFKQQQLGIEQGRLDEDKSRTQAEIEHYRNMEKSDPGSMALRIARGAAPGATDEEKRDGMVAKQAHDLDMQDSIRKIQAARDPAEELGAYRSWAGELDQQRTRVQGELDELLKQQNNPQWKIMTPPEDQKKMQDQINSLQTVIRGINNDAQVVMRGYQRILGPNPYTPAQGTGGRQVPATPAAPTTPAPAQAPRAPGQVRRIPLPPGPTR